jgi:hypothetical protein
VFSLSRVTARYHEAEIFAPPRKDLLQVDLTLPRAGSCIFHIWKLLIPLSFWAKTDAKNVLRWPFFNNLVLNGPKHALIRRVDVPTYYSRIRKPDNQKT